MVKEISYSGGRIDKIYVCPHDYGECSCRKPLPGLLDKAGKDFDLDLKKSWMIGDSDSDITLGKMRHCMTIYVGKEKNPAADFSVENLEQAVEIILDRI